MIEETKDAVHQSEKSILKMLMPFRGQEIRYERFSNYGQTHLKILWRFF
jgi:hypothetical protein